MTEARRPLAIAFVHPTLRLGGAERLIVDAAMALSERGHEVCLYVGEHDRAHSFPETVDGSLEIQVRGESLPSHLLGRAIVPLTMLRTGYAAVSAVRERRFDVLVTDLVAHILPLLRLASGVPTVFYCHYPDLLLAPRRSGLYRPYRAMIDGIEAFAMGHAERVLVNSEFTQEQVRRSFPRLKHTPTVVYPPVFAPSEPPAPPPDEEEILLLSLGRYEAKKGIELGLETMAALRERLPAATFARLRFIHAGSLNKRTPSAEETFHRLKERVKELRLQGQASLLGTYSESEKQELLHNARAVIYTPENEHFGIVPIEAMAAARPVIAARSGGPRESVIDGETGFLCEAKGSAFAEVAVKLIEDVSLARKMGQAGWERVRTRFSRAAFGRALEEELYAAVGE